LLLPKLLDDEIERKFHRPRDQPLSRAGRAKGREKQ
jgi:hypothetical protein